MWLLLNVLYIHSSVLPVAAETWHVTCSTIRDQDMSRKMWRYKVFAKRRAAVLMEMPQNMLPAFLAATRPAGLYQSPGHC